VSLLLNLGNNLFQTAIYPSGANPIALAAADVNGDGKVDLVVVNRAQNSIGVLLNLTK